MSDEPKDVIEFAIRSAFVCYPDWKSPHWIKPKECSYLAMAVILNYRPRDSRLWRADAEAAGLIAWMSEQEGVRSVLIGSLLIQINAAPRRRDPLAVEKRDKGIFYARIKSNCLSDHPRGPRFGVRLIGAGRF